jgi:anti-sigma regulatory factor (Ser/Thr protein kinase)
VTHQSIPREPGSPTRRLSLRFSSTRRGARLARRFAVQQLTEWTGLPYDSASACSTAVVTAELAANAVTHGSLPGRDFRLALLLPAESAVVRIEVTDTRPQRRPRQPADGAAPPDALSGRGLLLVGAYAECWGCEVRDAYTKTVWAEVALPSGHP